MSCFARALSESRVRLLQDDPQPRFSAISVIAGLQPHIRRKRLRSSCNTKQESIFLQSLSSNSQHGAVLIEIAMSASLFFFMVLTGCDLLRFVYNVTTSQYIATKFMRTSVLGKPTDTGGMTGRERGDAIEDLIVAQAAGVGIDLGSAAGDNPCVTVCAVSAGSCAGGDDAGDESQTISIRIRYPIRMIFGLVTRSVDVVAIGRNEPFNAD